MLLFMWLIPNLTGLPVQGLMLPVGFYIAKLKIHLNNANFVSSQMKRI